MGSRGCEIPLMASTVYILEIWVAFSVQGVRNPSIRARVIECRSARNSLLKVSTPVK